MTNEEAKATNSKIIEWKKDFKEYINSLSIPRDDYNGIMEYIDEFPNVEQTYGDLISRQAVIDIVKFECGEWVGLARTIVKAIEQLSSVIPQPSAEKTTLRNFTQPQTTDTDLISRESVITMLQKIENAVEDGDGFQFNEWIEYAKDIPSAEKTAEWIPVSERLPEEDGCYLVTTTGTNNDIIDIAYYTDGIWHKASRIKAWMPLQEPYKVESEE